MGEPSLTGAGGIRSKVAPEPPRQAPPEQAVTIIRPPGRWPGLGLDELWRLRSICLVLARRSLKARYRQTLLGAAWTILQPVLLMVVFTVFFGLLGRAPSQGLAHPVFYFLGLLPWQIMVRTLNEGSSIVVSNSALINRVYFPRAYLPFATGISALVDFFFALLALLVLLVVFGIAPSPAVVLIPVLVLIALAAGIGVALWLSALNTAYRDVAQVLPSLTQTWFFASPILYPSEIVPEQFRTLYYLNPMALVIDGFRSGFAGTPAPPPEAWLVGVVVAVGLLLSGYVFFRRREPTFADVV